VINSRSVNEIEDLLLKIYFKFIGELPCSDFFWLADKSYLPAVYFFLVRIHLHIIFFNHISFFKVTHCVGWHPQDLSLRPMNHQPDSENVDQADLSKIKKKFDCQNSKSVFLMLDSMFHWKELTRDRQLLWLWTLRLLQSRLKSHENLS